MLRRNRLVLEVIPNTEPQMESVLEAARRMPDLPVVLNHLGRPPVPEGGWEPWASQIVRAAALPNISVKLSLGGDVVSRWRWSTDALRRYSDHVLTNLGANRVMAASNWPVVLLSGRFADVWRGIEDLVSGLPAAGRAAVMGGTAERIYRLVE
jgi:L-fuconolactonase